MGERLHLQTRLFNYLIGNVHLGQDEFYFLVDFPGLLFLGQLYLQDSFEAAFLVLKLVLYVLGRNVLAPVLYASTFVGGHSKLGLGTAI